MKFPSAVVMMIMTLMVVDAKKPYQEKPDKDPSKIRYENGGLLVTDTYECLDQMDSCREKVGDDPEACEDDEDEVSKLCPVSCGTCEKTTKLADKRMTIGVQQKNDGTFGERSGVDTILSEMITYLKEEVMVDPAFSMMYEECQNKNELCAYWATLGECKKNRNYMDQNCMLACKRCDQHRNFNMYSKSSSEEL